MILLIWIIKKKKWWVMLRVYRNLFWFFKQEWKKYVVMLLLLILLSFLAIFPASILGTVIDLIASGSMKTHEFWVYVVLLIAFAVIRYVSNYAYHFLINSEGQQLSYELRKRYLNKLFSLDAKVYEKYTKGELISRISNDMQHITTAATTLLQELVYNGSLLIFTIGAMVITISWRLTLASVTIMPIAFFILMRILNHMRKYYKTHRVIYSAMTEKVLESIEGVKVVRAYVQEDTDYANLRAALIRDIESWRKIVRFESIFGPLFDFVYSLCYFIAFAYGTYLVINQNISVGNLITFTTYLSMLYAPIISLSNVFNAVNNAIISNDRYNEILNEEAEVKDDEHSKHIIDFDTIEFRNVSFKYPFDKHNVINNISFTIKKGETIGIVGPTGAGKSTIIRQLLREFNVTEGDIYIDGEPIESFKVEDLRNLVGYVPQSHILFRRGVDENILVGNPDAPMEEVQRAITFADFQKDLPYLSEGLHTIIGESGTTLSGGQKQRLSIARAMVKNPEILILDDSLSAVDAETEATIIRNLKEYRKGKTNIIVAHRFSAIREADQILVISEGRIIEKGTHEELLQLNGWYRRQYDKQNMEK